MKTNRARKVSCGNRRITSQRNLGLSNLSVIGRDDEITHHRELSASTQSVTLNRRDRDAIGFANPAYEMMKLLDHRVDFAGHVIGNLHAGGESTLSGSRKYRDLRSEIFNLRPRGVQFIQHFEVDDVQRRSIEHNTRDARAGMELNRRITHCSLPGGLPKPNGWCGP